MKYDIFISHASEDKKEIAKPLADLLIKNNLTVWYDEYSLSIGDSLTEKIEEGLSKSSLGVIILSNNFFNKKWPRKELNALSTIELINGKTILPIWHNVTFQDVVGYSPSLADKFSLNTSNGTEYITQQLIKEVIKKEKPFLKVPEQEWFQKYLSAGFGLHYIEAYGDHLDNYDSDDYFQLQIMNYWVNIKLINKDDKIEIEKCTCKQFVDKMFLEYYGKEPIKHALLMIGIGTCRLIVSRTADDEKAKQHFHLLAKDCFSRINTKIIERPYLLFQELESRKIENSYELERLLNEV